MTTEIKERPILFSGPMVRAILEGRKPQTRRVVKDQPNFDWSPTVGFYSPTVIDRNGNEKPGAEVYGAADETCGRKCPYGKPGDRLWVRETFSLVNPKAGCEFNGRPENDGVRYKATWTKSHSSGWKPSIFMPRWASRITLEITDIRVQRLQDISEEDAIAEGFDWEVCCDVLSKASGKIQAADAYYIEDEKTGDTTSELYCEKCANELCEPGQVVTLEDDAVGDGPAFCDRCYKPLEIWLTEYGVDQELRLNDPHGSNPMNFPVSAGDAAVLAMIAGYADLTDRQCGRLAQIGFATLWDKLNADRGYGWGVNPWVWAISFQRIEA